MADLASYGYPDRDIEQAFIALKKGTQLIKYSRKGKPKFCPFRLSPDETTLIWYSRGEERNLKLASVSKIIPGQRTPVFKRYRRPEKEYLSFSLIYKNGERSLDLICKDNEEAETWLAGLKSLICTGQNRSRRTVSDIPDLHETGSDLGQNGHPFGVTLEFTSNISRGSLSLDLRSQESSDVASGRANMQLRTSGADGFRISVSSTPSCSSHGSGPDDIESLGDVFVWGDVWCDGTPSDGSANAFPSKGDVLTPKALESNVVIDVHQIACGVRHFALITRQGEVFTCGEESGGRLGHGIEKDFGRPHLVDFLAVTNVEFVACGEYHTCVVSTAGDLYTWGDGSHNAGLLGHGTDASHWIPKRVSGPLEGLQVFSVACGSWHSALATIDGKIFTFGDGSFGALGHGDRESVQSPKEVQALNGLKTIKVACGVWHTAAIVEVINQHHGGYTTSRKLFTWGDGDKYRLGHGNKESCLEPTCISALVDYNFHQIACGHTMTVALTTSGHVFTMGSPVHGQLGNPQSDGKMPCLVQDRLVGEFVEEIACGAYHVAVLTSRSEVFTWGMGANGRLGHGDTEDRNSPTLLESLKDRLVKSISCGASFTASICVHKWVSGADQSVCSGCRQAFGFTRKRHNCYNCGLVHCHGCSSRKALKAALAPTPGKPHRVCDACYAKLKKAAESGNNSVSTYNRRLTTQLAIDSSRFDRGHGRTSSLLISPNMEPVKYLEIKTGKHGPKSGSYSIVRASQVPSFQQLKDIAFPSSLSALQNALKPATTTPQHLPLPPPQPPAINSKPASPYSRRPSPPRSTTPVFSRGVIDGLKKSNELLNQEVSKLQSQVKSLKQKSDSQDAEIRKLRMEAEEAASLAEEKTTKCIVAVDAFKCITSQLKELKEKLPPEFSDDETFKALTAKVNYYLYTHGAERSPNRSSMESDRPNENSSFSEVTNRQYHKIEENEDTQHNASSSNNTEGASQKGSSSIPMQPRSEGMKEVIEQFEPGVYVTVLQLSDGTKIFKRVRFSKRRFAEQQAEEWWKENKERLLKRYSPAKPHSASSAPPPPPAQENTD